MNMIQIFYEHLRVIIRIILEQWESYSFITDKETFLTLILKSLAL